MKSQRKKRSPKRKLPPSSLYLVLYIVYLYTRYKMQGFSKKTLISLQIILLSFGLVGTVFAQDPVQERKQLEQQLQGLENEINSISGDLTQTQQQKKTLQSQVSALQKKIQQLNTQINTTTKIVQDLKSQIQDTTDSIDQTTKDIGDKKAQLADALQQIAKEDRKGTFEIVLAGATLSDYFSNIAQLQALNQKNKDLLQNLKDLNDYLQTQQGTLESEKTDQENFMKIQILQKQANQSTQSQTQQLLAQTQGKETEYQKLLQDKQAQAQAIRSRIFSLIGVPQAPTFGEAYDIAKAVGLQTGVRPAFLLAVLTQESNLGQNVGQCFLKNTQTGSGTRLLTGAAVSNVMKPSRDVGPFMQIVQELNRDPLNTPVSCPIPSVGGYGGAMGPAQFIPSTWLGYKSKLSSILGRSADPWSIKDAFMAAGLYLSDYGAKSQTKAGETKAALIYFSGSSNSRYRFYSDSVLAIATGYEADIKALENGSLSINFH